MSKNKLNEEERVGDYVIIPPRKRLKMSPKKAKELPLEIVSRFLSKQSFMFWSTHVNNEWCDPIMTGIECFLYGGTIWEVKSTSAEEADENFVLIVRDRSRGVVNVEICAKKWSYYTSCPSPGAGFYRTKQKCNSIGLSDVYIPYQHIFL